MTSGTPAQVSVSADLQLVEFAPRIFDKDAGNYFADPNYRYIEPAKGYAGRDFCLSAWIAPEQAARIVYCVNNHAALTADLARERARSARLAEALAPLAGVPIEAFGWDRTPDRPIHGWNAHKITAAHVLAARAALATSPKESA